MTDPDWWGDRHSSRGQLLLVGAVILASVIIGLVIVVNSSLFIENASGPDSSGDVTQVSKIDYNLRQAARTVTLRVNHASSDHTASEIGNRVKGNVSNLSQITRVTMVSSQSTVVNATYDNSSSEFGTRVVQADDGYLTDDGTESGSTGGSDARTWEPVSGQNIGWFVMNVNLTDMTSETVWVNVSNSRGESVNISMKRVKSPSPDLRINSTVDGYTPSVTCDPSNRRVLLDLRTGESFTDEDCRFGGTTSITNASTVKIAGGDNVRGRYSVVANETGTVSGAGRGLPKCHRDPSDEPCRSKVVWTAAVNVSIQNSNTAYANNHNVSVYEVNR